MIHSTIRGKETPWMDQIQSPDAGSNSLEYTFSSLSLSTGMVGSRPPALSTSSISSFGEETSQRLQDNGYPVYAPPSPLTPSSTRRSQFSMSTATAALTSLSSPITTGMQDETNGLNNTTSNYHGDSSSLSSRPSMIQTMFEEKARKTNDSEKQQHHALDFQRTNSNSSITRGFSDLSSKQDDQLWSPHHNNHEFTPNGNGQIRSVKSDINDQPAFGSWPPNENIIMSPGNRSTHSLQNMGSVDENELFLGNRGRARTLSAGTGAGLGYRSIHNYGGGEGNVPMVSSEHQYLQQQYSGQPVGQQQIGRVSNFSFGRHGANTIQEGLVHPQSHCNELSAINPHFVNPRQRVMSADATINRGALGPMYRRPLYDNHDNMVNQPQLIPHHARPSSAGDVPRNRPRSLSSGGNHRRSPQQFLDPPSSLNDVHGKYYHPMHANDNSRFSILPVIQQKMMNDEESMMRRNPAMLHSHAVPEPVGSIPHNVKRVEPYHYYQSHGVIAGSTARVIYTVKFKRSQRNFVLSPHIPSDIKIGTHVKVEADRGEDLGIVLSRVPAEKFNHSSRALRYGNNDPHLSGSGMNMPEMKRIISVATSDEITLLRVKMEEEDELLKICRGKTLQRGLPMNVVDAEYQFDRHKLTFFFEAEGRIDFRELVRELFSIYKTRIWMQQIDKNSTGAGSNTSLTAAPASCVDSE